MSTCCSTVNIYILDYNPKNCMHIIKMLLYVHEKLTSLLLTSIKYQFSKFQALSIAELVLYTNSILNANSADIYLKDSLRQQPNIQFASKLSRFFGLIVEVVYSLSIKENGKLLLQLAENYVLQFSGNIKLVIDVTIKYNSNQKKIWLFKKNISLWQSEIVQDGKRLFLER